MEKFCEYFRKHAMNVINYKKTKMKRLTKEHQELNENANIFKEKFWK